MYGQSGFVCETIAWSTARCMSSGIAIEIMVYANASDRPSAPRRHSARQSRSSLRKVGSRPRSGGATDFWCSGMTVSPPGGGRGRSATIATALRGKSAARAPADEGREALAEAGCDRRRVERLPHLGHLAAAECTLAFEQRIPLGVEALQHKGKLSLARFELRFETVELVRSLLVRVDAPPVRLGCDRLQCA